MANELQEAICELCSGKLEKAILSNAKNTQYRKITVQRRQDGYQAEKLTKKQAFHENVCEEALQEYLVKQMGDGFKQLNGWGDGFEYSIKLSKKGKRCCFKRKKRRHL